MVVPCKRLKFPGLVGLAACLVRGIRCKKDGRVELVPFWKKQFGGNLLRA